MMNQLSNKDPTELCYNERIVFRKDVNTNNNWTFDLGNSGESTPTFVIVEFRARNEIDYRLMIMQYLIVYLFQMLFVKEDQKKFLLIDLSVIMIETLTVKHIKKCKSSNS